MISNHQPESIQAAGGGYGPPPGGFPPGGAPGGAPGGYGAPPPGGVPMAPPGGGGFPGGFPGGPGGMGGGGNVEEVKKTVQTWLILSCISLFCGCGLLAIIPILFAFQAKTAAEQGDTNTALEKIKISKICVIVGWVILALAIVLNVVVAVLGAM